MVGQTQTYYVARGLVNPKRLGAGTSRLIFTNQASGLNFNRYIPGSGVGGRNRSVQRYLFRQATSTQDSNGNTRQPCNCYQYTN